MAEPPTSVVSGVAYLVTQVDGRTPEDDSDFAGQLTLRVAYDPPDSAVRDHHELTGLGLVSPAGIFFNEKSTDGKDVRRWRITRHDDQPTYVAVQGLY